MTDATDPAAPTGLTDLADPADATDQLDDGRLRDAGLDPDAARALVARARQEVDQAGLPAAQLAVARDGEVVLDVALGDASPTDRIVIFSATKAVVAAAVWRLLDDGRLSLDQPVAEVVEGFGDNGKGAVTTRHLLTHTGGFPAAPMGPADWGDRERRRAKLASWHLTYEAGTHFEYHPSAGHWVLGALIEEATGLDHRDALRDLVLDPLGLDDLRVGTTARLEATARPVQVVADPPTPDAVEAALGVRLDLAELVGEVTDEAKVLLGRPDVLAVGIPGGGGASTAADLARFYQALLHDPADLWSPEVLAAGTATVACDLPDPILRHPAHRTLGLILAGDDGHAAARGFGHRTSPRAFGHNGAGGQVAWADPATGLSFAFVTDGHDRDLLREWRRTTSLSNRAAVLAGAPEAP